MDLSIQILTVDDASSMRKIVKKILKQPADIIPNKECGLLTI